MKKNLFPRVFAAIMVAVMLAVSCLSITAVSVSAPGNANEEDFYSIAYENGVLTVKVNPDKIHAMLSDGDLTKEELLEFIPADVLETFSAGKEVTLEDLKALVANYITVDDLKQLVNTLPIDVVRKYFSFDMLLDIFSVNEIIELLPVEEILSSVETAKMDSLLTDEVLDLVLNENLQGALLNEEYLEKLVNETSLVSDVLNDPVLKAKLVALVDNDVVNALMNDTVAGPNLIALASSDVVVNRVLADNAALLALENYLIADANHYAFDRFIHDHAVDAALVKIDDIQDFLLQEAVIHKLVEEDVITKDNIRNIFTNDQLSGLITSDVIDHLMSDRNFIDLIFADTALVNKMVTTDLLSDMYNNGYITSPDETAVKNAALTNADARAMLASSVRSNPNIGIDDYWAHVDFETLAFSIEGQIKDTLAGDLEAYDRLFNEVDPSDIILAIGMDACRALVHDNAFELINDIGMSKVLEYYSQDGIVGALGGYGALVSKNFITVDEVAIATGGYARLIGFFDANEVIDALGISTLMNYVNVNDILDSVGGYSSFLKLYTQDELKAILAAIGKDNIQKFIQDSGMIDAIKALDYKKIANDILDYVRSKAPEVKALAKSIVQKSLTILLTEIDGIYINGEIVYEAGSFDLNKIIIETLKAIPNIDDFLNLSADNIFAEYEIRVDIDGKSYNFGIEFGFLGDPTNLQNWIADLADNYKLDVSDNGDIDLMLSLPSTVSDICVRLLESERIPDALKEKLINLPTMTVEDVRGFIAGISEEEIEAIVDALKDKIEVIREKAYAEIEEKYNAYESKLPASVTDKLSDKEIQELIDNKTKAAMAKVDSLIDKITNVDKLQALQNKVVSLIDRVPEKLSTAQILDLYNGNGNFSASFGGAFDFYAVLSNRISLPEEIKMLFTSTVLSYNMSVDFTMADLYELELILADGSTYKTLLPAGVSLDVLSTVDKLGDLSSGFIAEDLSEIKIMPEADVKLYSNDLYTVQFVANNEIIDTVFYVYGTDSIIAPEVPAEAAKLGYTVDWEDYELNQEKRLTVELEYTAIKYTATFMADGNVVGTVQFTIEDTAITEPTVPAKTGYTGKWEAYTLEPKDITINAEYTAIKYTATFMADGNVVGTVQFTVEDTAITEPTVPAKTGYTGKWGAYTLEPKDITINAEYTAIKYKATFVADGKVVQTVEFTVESKSITEPAVPAKTGYTGAWESYKLEAKDITINAVYTAIKYKATFVADGTTVGVVEFTIEDKSITEPTVPAKTGYTGAWESYKLEARDITINAKYTPNVYKATFVADGAVVGIVEFTVEDKSIAEPPVPAKEGFTGKWESYTLGAADITINAIYTAIDAVDEDEGCFWWWILIILAIIIIALLIFFIIRSKKDDDNTPPADPEPIVEPEPEVETEVEPEVEPIVVPDTVDDIAPEEADELMTDDDALAAVVVEESETPAAGQKAVINIGTINDHFENGDTVTIEELKAKKLIPSKTGRLKILADGHLNKHNLTVEANSFSVQAIKMIQLTGGTVIQKK